MFRTISYSFIGLVICSSAALAGSAPRNEIFESYLQEVVQASGKSEADIRDEALETLRKDGRFKEADLERIGRQKIALDPAKQNAMVNLLKWSERFNIRTGLISVRNESIRTQAGAAFDAMAEVDSSTEARRGYSAFKSTIDQAILADVAADSEIPQASKSEAAEYYIRSAEEAGSKILSDANGRAAGESVTSLTVVRLKGIDSSRPMSMSTVLRLKLEVVLSSGKKLSYLVDFDTMGASTIWHLDH